VLMLASERAAHGGSLRMQQNKARTRGVYVREKEIDRDRDIQKEREKRK